MIRDAEYDDEGFEDIGDDLMPCPLCGERIYDDSESCPHCGEFIVGSTRFLSNKPLWFRALWVMVITFLIYQLIVWF